MKKNVSKFLSVLLTMVLLFSITITALAEEATPTPDPTLIPQETTSAPTEPNPEATTPAPTDPAPEETTPTPTEPAPVEPEVLLPVIVPLTGQAGTTLSSYKTASGHIKREWKWQIEKSVWPSTWDLFNGDSGSSGYTISVMKTGYVDTVYVNGDVCVTNGGAVATENLTIFDHIQYKVGSGQFQDLPGGSQTITPGQLAAGESQCYPYEIPFAPVAGAVYRNVATISITNHSGSLGSPNGPEPKADFSLPSSPDVEINDSIHVDDSNGSTWQFSDNGSVSYDKTFACDADKGTHGNTATIRETGQSANASVEVNCYDLGINKKAFTKLDRTYKWDIQKTGDVKDLTLALNQSYLVNYAVTVNMTGYVDNHWAANGTITISNPAPMSADLTGVSDIMTGGITAVVDCPSLTVPAFGYIVCTYTADLPDAVTRTNTATATQQNYAYNKEKIGTPSGTTAINGTAVVDFAGAVISQFDKCIQVTDTYAGALGQVCLGDSLPKTFTYSRDLGPYETCGSYTVDNTAAFETLDTNATGSASWTVNINVPCPGCSLTIGYWKTHAGLGPQADMVSPLLPQYLGSDLLGLPVGKSVKITSAGQAVQYLGFSGSNNVFDASNGINKLYAQLLAVKLNIANGANGAAVSSTISAADSFLTLYDSTSWASLSKANKNKVLGWVATLDNYNNGLIGPGHCSQ